MIVLMQLDWGPLIFGVLLLVAGCVLLWRRATIVRRMKAHEEKAREKFMKGEYLGQVLVAFSTGARMSMVTIFCFVLGAVAVVSGVS